MIELPLFIKYEGKTAVVHNDFGGEWEADFWEVWVVRITAQE